MGFNMSWIFVDGIDEDALYEALDLAPTGETPDRFDLGTSRVPLAGTTLQSGWCAVFAKYALVMDAIMGTDPPRLMRLPAKSGASAAWSWSTQWFHIRVSGSTVATLGKFDTTRVKEVIT